MQHLRIGITGGMGAGKSTICTIFGQLGIPIYDADARAKWLMKNDPELKKTITENFGWDSYTRKEELNREYLAKVVFNNEEQLKVLNSIVHPAVKNDYELWTIDHKEEPYSIKEAALLFETDSYKSLHRIMVVTCPIETRIERIIKRDHVKREDILKRIQNQTTDRERMNRADWVIYNDGVNSLINQAMDIHHTILGIRESGTVPFKILDMEKSLILNHEEISLKLDRIAWQILEQHFGETTIVLVGLVDRGFDVADKIKSRLEKNGDAHIELIRISLDKTNALASEITLNRSELITNNAVILVDDVLNSGTTMAASLKEVLNHNPKTVKTAVLANRDHHTFPIQANFVGISLATTVKEHISYEEIDGKMSVSLS